MNAVKVRVLVPGVYSVPKGEKSSAVEANRGNVIEIVDGAYLNDVLTLGYVELADDQPAQPEVEVAAPKPQKRGKRNG